MTEDPKHLKARSKGYQIDEDEQYRLSSMPGVSIYTLEGALTDAMYPVFEYFLRQTKCSECATIATQREVMEALPALFKDLSQSPPPKFCKDHEPLD